MLVKICLHLALVAHYAWITYFLQSMELPPGRVAAFGGQWKFLTFWNLCFQLIYFVIALLNDFTGTEAIIKSKSSKLQTARDFFFSSIAFPLAVFVSGTFWIIFAYNRELIFPLKVEKYYPFPTNHMMHTTPIVGQLMELFLSYHIYPNRKVGLATVFSVFLVYLTWICFIAYFGGFWVYGVLQVMSPLVRTVFIIVCCLLGSSFYLVGEKANSLVWSKLQCEPNNSQGHQYQTRSKAKMEKSN